MRASPWPWPRRRPQEPSRRRTPFSAAPDLVRDGVDGVVVEPSADAIANAVEALLADERLSAELSAAARIAGAARDWHAIATRMESIYGGEPAAVQGLRWS